MVITHVAMATEVSSVPHHKEHLSLVVVGQEEEPGDCVIRDLVVKCLSMELQEGRVTLDCVTTSGEGRQKHIPLSLSFPPSLLPSLPSSLSPSPKPWREDLNLGEDSDGVSGGLDDVGLCESLLVELLHRVTFSLSVGDVEPHLHEGDRGILTLMELQGHLILP